MNAKRRINLREVVRQNCVALFLNAHHDRQTMSWAAFAADTKIGNGTAQRINEMSADASLSTLQQIADHYGMEPWHMLLPKLDAANPPVFLMTDTERSLYQDLARSARAIMEQRAAYEPE